MRISLPTAQDIIALRKSLQLSQPAAAALIHKSYRAWQQWEGGFRQMDLADWELFLLKAGRHPDLLILPRHDSFSASASPRSEQ